ncbi:MAG: sulfide/dihydroorotate dehydrogenase-like FAD/NAD-binding protein [Omnitrophica bacterium]|nr:sulfide/dihydroorotate dehydrogenase-like FAD/NAD-binding protein [Candidatus Omnitrophota bacterium]
MNKIISREELAPNIKKLILEAPFVADKVQPGQFVVIVVDEKGERIPLTVVDKDKKQGTITLIFQEVGKTTCRLGQLKATEEIHSLLGPLGKATEIKRVGKVITVGGGVGIAEVYPVTHAFKEAGNKVTSIIGVRNKDLLFLEQELRKVSDELLVATDDGSYGHRGNVCDVLKEIFPFAKADLVYAVGPVVMMQAICELTRPSGTKTLVSLNPIMVDATGMCASCRVSIKGEMKFGCVDGPEFDAHEVDFDQLAKRLKLFSKQEKKAMECCKDR